MPANNEPIPSPQTLAMKAYIAAVEQVQNETLKPEEFNERMSQCITIAIECCARAQRYADAFLIDVIGSKKMDLRERETCGYVANVLRGETILKELANEAQQATIVEAG